jgi:flagellar biosynthesis protein FlhB
MSDSDNAEKEHEPSQKRLDDARAKGEIARSADLVTACSYASFVLATATLGSQALKAIGGVSTVLLDQADSLGPQLMHGGAASFGAIMSPLLWAMFPFLGVPGLAALAYLAASKTLIFTPEKLAPKLSRISPLSAAKQKFGRSGLFEFAKSCIKLAIMATALACYLVKRADDVIGTLYLQPSQSILVLLRLSMEFLFIVLAIAVLFGGLDYMWQHAQHIRQNRMSRKDVMDESRDQDGDPHMKAQRRQRGYDIATNQMLADVPKADVIIVNPTHYAVALKWNRAAKQAPMCIAKGTDEIAARIREKAAEAGIPIHSDAPTARALHASVEIGQEIQAEHYRAVAAAIRFAEAMRKRARKVRK